MASEDLTDRKIIRALAHPLRTQILGLLDEGIASPKEMSARLGSPLGTVSYHVTILRDLGMIELVRQTPRRGAVENHYRAKPRKRLAAGDLSRMPGRIRHAAAKTAWTQIQQAVTGQPGKRGADVAVEATTVVVDDKGREALLAEIDRFLTKVRKIEEDSTKRLNGSGAVAGGSVTVGAVLADRPASPDT